MSEVELDPREARTRPEVVPEPVPAPPQREGGPIFDTGLGAGMGPPTLLRHLARRPPDDRKAGIEDLNDRVGNRRTTQMIARFMPAGAFPGPAGPDIDLATASDDQKLEEIRKMISDHGFFNPNGSSLVSVWTSFGDRLPAVANANADLWAQTVEIAPGIVGSTRALETYRQRFKGDVEATVLDTLDANRQFVLDNMTGAGLPMSADEVPGAATPAQDKQLAEQQTALDLAAKAMSAKQLLLKIPVGYLPELDHDEGGSFDVGASQHVDHFRPGAPPSYPGYDDPGMRSWEEVKEKWDLVQMFLTELMSRYPIVQSVVTALGGEGDNEFAARRAGEATGGLSKMSPQEARRFMSQYLRGTLAKIEEAVPLVGNDLDYHDFEPVHARMFAGAPTASGMDWSQPFEQSVARMDVRLHNFGKIMKSLGLGTLSAAAFILAEFATAGMATFLLVGAGIGIGAAQAAMSWDEYADLAKAQEASTDPKAALISKEQVDSAAFAAVLDTVFVFADAAGAIGPFSKAARASRGLVEATEAGMKAGAHVAVKEGLAAGGPGAINALRQGVREIGLQGTIQASGKSADQLIAIAREAGDLELVARLTSMADVARGGKAVEEIAAKLPALAQLKATGQIAPDAAEALVRQSIEQFGMAGTIKKAGGWKALTKTLGDNSAVAREMDAWRKALLEDLQKWVQKQSGGDAAAVRTGNETAPTNDLDINMMEIEAASMKDRAKQYLAGRAGVGSDELASVLDAAFMVDPTRMHLQDVARHGLSKDARAELQRGQALFDEQMLYGRRIHDAGPGSAEADAIRAQAQARGITPMEFKPLSETQRKALELQVDQMIKQLDGLTEEAAKKDLIMQIHQSQAMINASTPDAYLMGGGVALNVSKREIDKAKMPAMFDDATSAAERYGAALDETTFIDAARRTILASESGMDGLAARLSDEVKSLGKHGDRMAVQMGKEAAGEPLAKLTAAVDRFQRLVKSAKTGGVAARTKTARDLKILQAEIRFNCTKLESLAATRLKEMREAAGLGQALAPDVMEEIQKTIAFRASAAALAHQVDAITMAIGEIAQGTLRAGAGDPDAGSGDGAAEPNQSIDPNAALAPVE